MSYARFGDGSDVYIFLSGDGLECSGCVLNFFGNWTYPSTQSMVDHLVQHEEAGYQIPATIIGELWQDDQDNFAGSAEDRE